MPDLIRPDNHLLARLDNDVLARPENGIIGDGNEIFNLDNYFLVRKKNRSTILYERSTGKPWFSKIDRIRTDEELFFSS